MKRKRFLVFAIFYTGDLVLSNFGLTYKEAKEWIKKHPIYNANKPMYIIEAQQFLKEEEDGSDIQSSQAKTHIQGDI